jgi:hypothetical protein
MPPINELRESQDHPLGRGQYGLFTPPINDFFATVFEWIESRVTGGYIYGVPRLGKSRAVQFWIEQLLSEKYHGLLPLFRLIYKEHDRFSEHEFLSDLLDASHHKYSASGSRKVKLERLVRLYAARARNAGGNHIVLMIDEAQYMGDSGYRTLCNRQNELDDQGYHLTVISVGSHELAYQHEVFIQSRPENQTQTTRIWTRSRRLWPRYRTQRYQLCELCGAERGHAQSTGRNRTCGPCPPVLGPRLGTAEHEDSIGRLGIVLGCSIFA